MTLTLINTMLFAIFIVAVIIVFVALIKFTGDDKKRYGLGRKFANGLKNRGRR